MSPRRNGQAAVELALVLPVLLLLVLALVQVGLLARDQLMVVQASRAGAREAAVTADEGAVHRAVESAVAGLDAAFLDVLVTRAGTRGDPVTVAVRYRSAVRVPFLGWLLPESVELAASATTRQEFS